MATNRALTTSPGEQFGIAFDFTKSVTDGATITQFVQPSVQILRGTHELVVTDAVLRAGTAIGDASVTVPAGSAGHRWRITIVAETSNNVHVSLSTLLTCI